MIFAHVRVQSTAASVLAAEKAAAMAKHQGKATKGRKLDPAAASDWASKVAKCR